MIEQHLSIDEVAARLAVSARTVHRAIDRGRRTKGRAGIWPAPKLGHRMIRIPESAVARFLDRAGKVGS
jgi:excisionase family DNA binding protein